MSVVFALRDVWIPGFEMYLPTYLAGSFEALDWILWMFGFGAGFGSLCV